jgi:nucleoside-diphosphate-sugar epimerase
VAVHHLVGAREAAVRLGMRRVQVFHQARQRDPESPAPVYWVVYGPGLGVWYWPDVWHWARRAKPAGVGELGPLRATGAPARSRLVDVDDLVDAHRLAAGLGVRYTRGVHEFRRYNTGFPEPVFVIEGKRTAIRLWAWPDVRRWAEGRGRSVPVRPPAD